MLRDPVIIEVLQFLARLHSARALTPETVHDPVLAQSHHLLAGYRVPAPA